MPHFVEADLTDIGETLVDTLERASVEQIRRVHDVTAGPQVVGERAHAWISPGAWWTSKTSVIQASGWEDVVTLRRHRLAGKKADRHSHFGKNYRPKVPCYAGGCCP